MKHRLSGHHPAGQQPQSRRDRGCVITARGGRGGANGLACTPCAQGLPRGPGACCVQCIGHEQVEERVPLRAGAPCQHHTVQVGLRHVNAESDRTPQFLNSFIKNETNKNIIILSFTSRHTLQSLEPRVNRFGYSLFDLSRAEVTEEMKGWYVVPPNNGQQRVPVESRKRPHDLKRNTAL